MDTVDIATNSEFAFRLVCETEVSTAFRALTTNSSSDGIPLKLLSHLDPVIFPYLTSLINSSIEASVFPQKWKHSSITPIPKIPNPSLISDFRPISILPLLSKVYERLLSDQITEYLTTSDLLNNFQSGFRKKHSTCTALSEVCYDISKLLDDSQFCILVLIDFSKAFDTMSHMLLCQKLHLFFKFSPSACLLIHSYLTARTQQVSLSGVKSRIEPVLQGVPQGSILGPLLFSIFINDINARLQYSKYHMYADDLQIYLGDNHENLYGCFNKLNCDLQAISDWSKSNGLQINVKKTQALFFNRRYNFDFVLPAIYLNGLSIDFVNKVKNLGVIFNCYFDWSDHVSSIVRKVYGTLSALRPFKYILPANIKLVLIRSLIVPHFLYCDVLFYKTEVSNFKRLQLALKSCVRFVYGLSFLESTAPYIDNVFGCSLETYYRFRAMLFLYGIKTQGTPGYLARHLSYGGSLRMNNFILERANRDAFRRNVFYDGSLLFNSLPHNLKSGLSLSQFRVRLWEHLTAA